MSDLDQIKNIIRNLANLNEFSDVILVAGKDNQKFPVHRVILAASSEYFKALLGPKFREGSEKLVTLRGIDGPTLKRVIDFIYTGNVTITNENVHDIVMAASSMELLILEARCATFWESILAVGNCVEILSNADKYHLRELASKAEQFICEHFEFIPINELQKIDAKNFKKLLTLDDINADESVIFDRMVHWLEVNADEPSEVHTNLIKLIQLGRISGEFLIERVEPFFKQRGFMDLVIDEYHKRVRSHNKIVQKRREGGFPTHGVSHPDIVSIFKSICEVGMRP